MVAPINGQYYNYFQAKPVTEREAKPVYGGNNFFVNPPEGAYFPPSDLFKGNTVGLSGLVANATIGNGGERSVSQSIAPQAGYTAGASSRSWVC